MLIKRKRNSVITWFNCIIIVDSPLESLQQLSDGRHFKRLIHLIDPTTEDELSEDVDTYKFIEEFLNGYFHSQVGAFIDTAACLQGDEVELAKISILLLSAVVQSSLSKENDFLTSLTQLDDSVQEDIRDFMQAVMFPNGDRLSADFCLVLTQRKQQYSDSPLRTPRRSTRRNSVLSPSSPLMTFIDSPMFVRQTTIRTLEATVASLRQQLHTEENRATEIEVENGNLKQSIKNKENEVKELREKLRENHACRDSAEESSWASIDNYKAEIQSLTNQLKEYQNTQLELSRMQEENGELLKCNNNLQTQIEDYKLKTVELQRIASELSQAQATIESQKDFIEQIHIENNNLKRSIDEKENEVKTVRSLYDDAMQEVRNLQNSPELPKGESMKVVVEMQVEELEKEIRHLKEKEIELTDHLKTSARRNDSLKKDVAAAEEKYGQVEERLANVLMFKEKELSERDSRIAFITNDNHSLHEKLQNVLDELNQQKRVEEQKTKAHIAEIDRLKNLAKQEQVQHQETVVNLRTELSDMNDKLKAYDVRERESMAKINQLLSQNDSLSQELKLKAKQLSETESSLKASLECKESEICALKSKKKEATKKQSCLEKKLQDLCNERDCMKQALERESETRAAELERVVNSSKQALAEYEESKAKLLEELSGANSQLKHYREKEENSEKSLNLVVAEKNALLQELELMKTKLSENEERLNNILTDKEQEINEFDFTISVLKQENQSLEGKIQNLVTENNQLKIAAEETSQTLSSEMKRLKEEFSQQLDVHIDNQNKLNTQLSDAHAKLKSYSEMEGQGGRSQSSSQARPAPEELEDWKTKFAELQLKFSKQVEVCDGLRGALDKLVIENGDLQNQLSASRMQHDELAQKLASTEQNCTVLSAQKREKDKEADSLSRQVQDLQNILNQKDEKYQKDVREMQNILDGLKEQTRSSESRLLVAVEKKDIDLREAEKTVQQVTAANAELTKEINQLKLEKSKLEENLVISDAPKEKDDGLVKNLFKQVGDLQNILDEKTELYAKESTETQGLISSLRQENKSVKESNSSLQEKSNFLEKELQKANEIIDSKDTELTKIGDCLKEIQTSYSGLSSEMQQLKLEKARLEEELDEKNKLHMCNIDSEKLALEKMLEEANQNFSTLMNESKEKDDSIDRLSKQVQILEESQAHNDLSYKAEIKKFEDSLHNFQEQNKVLKAEHSTVVQNLYCEIEKKEKDLERAKKEIQELEEASRKKEKDDERAKKEIQELKEASTKKEKDLERAKKEIQELKEASTKKEKDLERAKKDVQELEEASGKKEKDLERAKKEIQELKEASRKKEKDLERAKKGVQELEEASGKKERDLERAKKEIQELKETSRKKEKDLERAKKEIQELKETSRKKEKDLERAKKEIQELKEASRKKESEFRAIKETLKEVETSKSKLVNEISRENSSVIENLQADLEKLREDNRGFRLSVKNYESEKSCLLLKVKDSERSIAILTEKNQKQDENICKLSKQIEELQHTQEEKAIGQKLEIKNVQGLVQKSLEEKKELESNHAVVVQNLNCCIEDKMNHIEKLLAEVQELKELHSQRNNEIESMQKSVKELETLNSSLRSNVATLQAEALKKTDDFESEIKRLSSYYQERENKINSQKKDVEDENEDLKSKISLKDQEVCDVNEMLAMLESVTESKESKIIELKEKIESLKKLLESVTLERNNLQKHVDMLDASKQELMEKLQDTERRHDNLMKQKEIAESDFSRCVEKRDEDIEKLNKQLQELEVKSTQKDSKSPESKLLMEIQNLNQSVQLKEKEIEKNLKKIHELSDMNKQKDESLKKIKNSVEEVETARLKLLTEISCLNEEKQIDKEKIDKLTSDCKRLSSYSQQQKKMIEEMKEIQQKLLDSDKENKVVQQKYLEHKRKNDQRVETLKKTIAKLEKEKEELEKCLLSLKQKVIGYQNASESCKQALLEERKRVKAVKKELEESENARDELSKQINGLEQSLTNYKQQKSCLEKEVHRIRSELSALKDKYEQDFNKPASRRFSSPLSPFVSRRQQESGSPMVDSQFLSPCAWKKPHVKKRISNASSLASTISTSNETVNSISTLTPIKADEEDFLNYSSLAELKSEPRSVTKSTKRLSELQRRNTLCPPHMRSSYPVETQMRPVCEFTDEIIKSGFVGDDESQEKKVSAETHPNAKKVRQNVNRIVHEKDTKGASPKRKRTNSGDSGSRRVKVKKNSATSSDKGR